MPGRENRGAALSGTETCGLVGTVPGGVCVDPACSPRQRHTCEAAGRAGAFLSVSTKEAAPEPDPSIPLELSHGTEGQCHLPRPPARPPNFPEFPGEWPWGGMAPLVPTLGTKWSPVTQAGEMPPHLSLASVTSAGRRPRVSLSLLQTPASGWETRRCTTDHTAEASTARKYEGLTPLPQGWLSAPPSWEIHRAQ